MNRQLQLSLRAHFCHCEHFSVFASPSRRRTKQSHELCSQGITTSPVNERLKGKRPAPSPLRGEGGECVTCVPGLFCNSLPGLYQIEPSPLRGEGRVRVLPVCPVYFVNSLPGLYQIAPSPLRGEGRVRVSIDVYFPLSGFSIFMHYNRWR